MARYAMSDADYEGYGVYEHYSPVLSGMGQVPDLSALSTPECINGLGHVPAAQKAVAKQALELMVFFPSGNEGVQYGGISGEASLVMGDTGGSWVSDLVAQGYVVMAERTLAPTGSVSIMATALPASVVLFAGCPDPKYLIVDAHPAALAAAQLYKASGAPAVPPEPGEAPAPDPSAACPAGMVGVPPYCISAQSPWPQPPAPAPLPGAPEPVPPLVVPPAVEPTPAEPAAEPQKAALPSWAVPVAIGGGLLVITAAVLYSARRNRAAAPAPAPTTMAANFWR